MSELRTIVEGLSYLEGPRWHRGCIYVSDFYNYRVAAITVDGAVATVCKVEKQPSGIGWLPDGSMLVVSMKDRRVLRLEGNGTLVEHADLSGLASWHCNDMVVDGQGRAYVGNFGFDLMGGADPAAGELIRVDPDGTSTLAAKDMLFPNGMVITADGSTLIVAESLGQRLTAFAIEADGSLTNRRVWASFGDVPTATDFGGAMSQIKVAPDGICLDAEGCIWFADAFGNRAVRVREGGEIVDEVSGGDLGIFACMLGGHDGRTLFLCAAPTFVEAIARADHQARLLATTVPVPHAGLP
ncbi:MAG: SMP-30/gluconolactonase/LRE family protein [Acidimicrobiia bacterium]